MGYLKSALLSHIHLFARPMSWAVWHIHNRYLYALLPIIIHVPPDGSHSTLVKRRERLKMGIHQLERSVHNRRSLLGAKEGSSSYRSPSNPLDDLTFRSNVAYMVIGVVKNDAIFETTMLPERNYQLSRQLTGECAKDRLIVKNEGLQ